MISDKFDEVSRNAIWTEHCIREAKALRMNDDFGGIRSPEKMVIIPEKPNRIAPHSRPTEKDVEKAKDTLRSMCVMKSTDATPEQQFVLPVTSNQDYGFFHVPLKGKEPLFHHPKGGCDVTKYADAYYTMTGRSPYARKDTD